MRGWVLVSCMCWAPGWVSAQEACISDAARERASCPSVPTTSLVLTRENRSGVSNERAGRASASLRDAIAADTDDRSAMERAVASYRRVLDANPELDTLDLSALPDATPAPTRDGVRVYLAEAYWKLERWSECARTLDALAEDVVLDAERRYLRVLCHNSAYQERRGSALHAGENQQRPRRRGRGRRLRRPFAEAPTVVPRELTVIDRGLIDAFRRYLCAHPDSDDAVTVRYRLARFYYEGNHDEDAALLFEQIAREHPEHELGTFAANLWLDSLNMMASQFDPPRTVCLTDLENAVEPLRASYCGSGTNEDLCSVLDALRCNIGRRRAERSGGRDRHAEAAAIYLELATEECGPSDELIYNAAIHQEAASMLDEAITTRVRLVERHPDSYFTMRAMWQVARNHHAVMRYAEASRWYARFAERYPGEDCSTDEDEDEVCPNAVVALRNAIALTMPTGSVREVRALGERFTRSYERRLPEDVTAVELELARWLEPREPRHALALVEGLLRERRAHLAPEEILEAHLMSARVERRAVRAREHLQRVVDLAPETVRQLEGDDVDAMLSRNRARDTAGEAHYRLAEIARAEWERGLRRASADERVGRLREVEAQYNAVARYESVPWMRASARRIGEMYLALAERSTGDEATGLRGTARDRLEFCFMTGVQTRSFDEHGRACAERLTELDLERWPAHEELSGTPGYVHVGQAHPGAVPDRPHR